MAGGKEVRTKIASVKNTQKITKAMEMVAASKMRKAQDRMLAARPYSEKIRNVISHLAHANPEYKHPYLVTREEVKRIGLIVVSTDRGLCGGLNANMFRMLLKKIQNWEIEGKEIDLCVIGTKAAGFFGSIGVNIIGQVTHIGVEFSPAFFTDQIFKLKHEIFGQCAVGTAVVQDCGFPVLIPSSTSVNASKVCVRRICIINNAQQSIGME